MREGILHSYLSKIIKELVYTFLILGQTLSAYLFSLQLAVEGFGNNGYSSLLVKTLEYGSTKLNLAIFTEQNNKITKSRELLLADAINIKDYKEVKFTAENIIIRLEARIHDLTKKVELGYDIFGILDESLENLKNIVNLYEQADVEGKQFILSTYLPH